MSNVIYLPPAEEYDAERWEIHERHMSFRVTKHKDLFEYRAEYRLPFQPEWLPLYLSKRIDGKWDADAHTDLQKVLMLARERYAEVCERETTLGRMGGSK